MAQVLNREENLARTFVELADSLVDDFDIVDLLSLLAERSVELFGVDAAGLVLFDQHKHIQLVAATSEAMELVEVFQIQNYEGPCHDCCHAGERVIADDLEAEGARWPRFVPVAVGAGFRSAHAVPMRLRGRVLGALNLFSARAAPLGHRDAIEAQALAAVATIAILQHRAAERAELIADQLHGALNSRVMIEQAKGVVAERMGVGMGDAFTLLRAHARSHRRLLAAVAEDVLGGRVSMAALKSS